MTLSILERRVRGLEAEVARLGAWRDREWADVAPWTFSAPGQGPFTLHPGQAWPVGPLALNDQPVILTARWVVPDTFAGHPLDVDLDVGGEALLTARLDGDVVYTGGLNPYHRRAPVTPRAVAGQVLDLEVEAVPRGLFGSPVARPHLEWARACIPQVDVTALVQDLDVVVAAIRTLGHAALGEGQTLDVQDSDAEIALRLLNVTDEVLSALAWPSAAGPHLARLRELGGGEAFTQGLWSLPAHLPPREALDAAVLARVATAHAALRRGLADLRAVFPPQGTLGLTGHAHLDLGWLWPVHETRRKARRTLHTVLELMKRDPDFTFNQSSAQVYAWIERDDPDLFRAIAERVREGRFEPVGGMWVEPDCQMSGGEALARHLLYGQTYFQETFGRTSTVAWLPDTFGFTPALPQLLTQSGIPYFFTTKLNWNEETAFPHDLFHWEGLGGARVLAHSVNNPGGSRPGLGGYNGDIRPNDLRGAYRRFRGRTLRAWGHSAARSLFTFGYGDGGGGPSAPMLAAYAILRDFPALPALKMTRVDDFFAALPDAGLPVWRGELYLELHRGTLTSQVDIKRLNRQAEHRLLEAEAALALHPTTHVQDTLDALWKVVLLNQFHDILPGSSISEVYRDALPELQDVVARVREMTAQAWTDETDATWTVFNPATWPRPLSLLLPGVRGRAAIGSEAAATQTTAGGLLVHDPDRIVPPLGTVTLTIHPDAPDAPGLPPHGAVTGRRSGNTTILEHATLRAEFDADGQLTRLHDVAARREVLGPEGHRLIAYPDLPYAWDAWDVARGLEAPDDGQVSERLTGGATVDLLDTGPLQASVRIHRTWRASRVTQTFVLRAGSDRLDVHTQLDWHERYTLLRAVTDVNARTHEAWYETALGAHARPTHRNAPADAARFEVSAHRWMDMSETGYGVALLNDGRYGHAALEHQMALSLVRGSMWPDPQADVGVHDVTYALYPHTGDWRAAHVVREAFDLNSPLVSHPGRLHLQAAPVLCGLPLMLSSLKRSMDGQSVILRLYEPHGQRGLARVDLGGWTARRVNVLEGPTGDAETGDHMTLDVQPYELITLRLDARP